MDHAPRAQQRVTTAIQVILGITIVLSAALLLYALVSANVDAPRG